MLWLFVMEGSFRGEERTSKVGLCQTSSRFAQAPVVVLTVLHHAVASTLSKPEWQHGLWVIPRTRAVPVNLQAYKTAS